MTAPINRALLTVLENQVDRTHAALEDLDHDTFVVEPGHDCNSIQRVGHHLVGLRRFQLGMLDADRAARVDDPDSIETIDDLRASLDRAADLLRDAIAEHDPDDWYAVPNPPRAGKWGDEPTIVRLVRPLNDFTNHLGGIRVIRRVRGVPSSRTQ